MYVINIIAFKSITLHNFILSSIMAFALFNVATEPNDHLLKHQTSLHAYNFHELSFLLDI